jgi:hypothetical protein
MVRTVAGGLVLVVLAMTGGYLLVGTGYAVVHFARQSWQVLGVRQLEGPPPAAPAFRPYPRGQLWPDLAAVLRGTGERAWQAVARLHRRFWGWFNEASPPVMLVSLPMGASLAAGTALVALPVAAGALALVAVAAGVAALWGAALLVTWLTLGLAERGLRWSRRIVVACPHPGCYHRFRLPVYGCADADCDRRHPRLVPGGSGIWRHACGCGASLPTLVVLGRHRLAGYCPRCEQPLPRRTGRVRVEHVPVVGGPDAGKSTFLCLAIGALEKEITSGGGSVEYPDQRDQLRWRDALAALRSGVRLPKTPVELPPAVMLDTRPRRAEGRILYLFDPAGETYDAAELLDGQRYLDHAEVALVVVDPLAIPGVWRGFTAADHRAVGALAIPNQPQVVREGPGELVDRLVGMLRTRDGGARLRRVLLVVSKSDVLRETSVGRALAGPEPDVRGWLEEVGWGNWARALEECGGEVRYLASGLDIDDATVAGAVGWLTGADGDGSWSRGSRLRGSGLRGRAPAQSRPWRSYGRNGLIPRGHLAGRLVMQVLGVPVAVAAGLVATAAPFWWVWSVLVPA